MSKNKVFQTEGADAIQLREYPDSISLDANGFECVEIAKSEIPAFIEFLKQFIVAE